MVKFAFNEMVPAGTNRAKHDFLEGRGQGKIQPQSRSHLLVPWVPENTTSPVNNYTESIEITRHTAPPEYESTPDATRSSSNFTGVNTVVHKRA